MCKVYGLLLLKGTWRQSHQTVRLFYDSAFTSATATDENTILWQSNNFMAFLKNLHKS